MQIPEITKEVDTIYFYPTAVYDDSEDAPKIVDIDSEALREGAQGIFIQQGPVFEDSTNVFGPYYRQSNLSALGDMDSKEVEKFQMNEQRTDVYAALDYYFNNYNNGRPFILAGHSQGSMMIKIVLEDYMQAHPEYYDRMVAAYQVGWSMTKDDLKNYQYLKFAEGADDTGVVVSWNTEGYGNEGQHNAVVLDGAISINPINWQRNATYASADQNLGSLIKNRETGEYEIVKGVADAKVNTDRGVVICTTDKVNYTAPTSYFGPASFHGNDYNLYHENVKENVATRVEKYLSSHK